jgi:hypothetical protein
MENREVFKLFLQATLASSKLTVFCCYDHSTNRNIHNTAAVTKQTKEKCYAKVTTDIYKSDRLRENGERN